MTFKELEEMEHLESFLSDAPWEVKHRGGGVVSFGSVGAPTDTVSHAEVDELASVEEINSIVRVRNLLPVALKELRERMEEGDEGEIPEPSIWLRSFEFDVGGNTLAFLVLLLVFLGIVKGCGWA